MAVGRGNLEVEEIVKARIDKREYRRIVLRNSLDVLLISDPDTDKCAASMSVGVGSFSDPEGLDGLAHFLEHMLFYASEKYPLEDSYSKYIIEILSFFGDYEQETVFEDHVIETDNHISKRTEFSLIRRLYSFPSFVEHGGSTNAFTASDQTNYFFDVNADCFEKALDRFAQFFIKPLMSADATTREIKAVDSENQKNLLSDGWRMHQLQKHLSAECHPYHKFSTGNWETLEVSPKAKGIDTRQELLKFYDENYSASLMHLVIYGKENLDKLQLEVEEKFQEIRNTDISSKRCPGQPCLSEHLQILVRAIPIKEGDKLKIVWPVTPEIHHYKDGPCKYLGHLIGHEGEGSLYYVLKTMGWATGLSAGESEWSLDYSFFTVIIELTDAGHDHMQDIIGLLFKYISLLQQSGICEWIFDELSAVCETKFHYQDKIPPSQYVVSISSNMQLYPPKDWLVGSSLPLSFNPSTIKMVLDQLSPNNVRIFWESKKFEGQTNLSEPWYGTAYSIENVSSSTIQKWMQLAPNGNLHLPAPNVFIPSDLSLKNSDKTIKFPVLLRKSSHSTLWFKPDATFSTPKGYVKIDFNCPHAGTSPETELLAELFTRLLMDYLNEYAYYAQVAGLYYSVSGTDCGFQVAVIGYNHKLRILLETVVKKLARFTVIPDRFSVIKEMVTKEYQNLKFQQPYQQAMYYSSLMLNDHSWPWMEQLGILPLLEVEDLARFVPVMLSRMFLECYIAGNIESNEAESMIQHIEDVFFNALNPISQPLYPSQYLTNRVVKLERGMNYFYSVEGLNPCDENSALVHYIQVHRDDSLKNVKLQLFALIAKQAAFHQLRTVEQLGYITALMPRNYSGIHGVQFIIQSTVKGPRQIDLRVEAFLEMFEATLKKLTNEEFKSNVNALIDMKLEKHKNLREESVFYWREIADGTLKFDRRESEVSALKQLTHQQLMDFFNEHIKVGASQKKSLSVRVYGSSHTPEFTADKNEPCQPKSLQIDDIFSFRRSQALYGSFKGGFGHVRL